jgi:hypothetical protein
MVGQPHVYAVAAVAACLGVLALSVASAWSQGPPPPTGGTAAPPGLGGAGEEKLPPLEPTGGLTGRSGGKSASPEPAPIPVVRASQAPPADQDAPERQQRAEREAPMDHVKPKHQGAVERPEPKRLEPEPMPALTPVTTFAQPLPATGMDWWTLALTGVALLAMGSALRSAAAPRPA